MFSFLRTLWKWEFNSGSWTELYKSSPSWTRGMKLGDKCSKTQANCAPALQTPACTKAGHFTVNHCQHIRVKHISSWSVNIGPWTPLLYVWHYKVFEATVWPLLKMTRTDTGLPQSVVCKPPFCWGEKTVKLEAKFLVLAYAEQSKPLMW